MALSKRQVYLTGAGASALGRAVEAAGAFATVWLLTRILAKEDYGYYVVAFTLLDLLAVRYGGR